MAAGQSKTGKDAREVRVVTGGVRLTASGFYGLYRPSRCEKRVYLLVNEPLMGQPSELEQMLQELGERHEKEHLSTFPRVRNLGDGSLADRAQRTREAVQGRAEVIYQGVLRAVLPGSKDTVTGMPDFMILEGSSYRIRDCKLSRSVESHPEIQRQLQTYGWLFQKTFHQPPAALEAYLGSRTIAVVPYAGPLAAEKDLAGLRDLALLPGEPWEPVGWSKCAACPFQERCWSQAEKGHDVSMVYGVDQGTARALREKGIRTYDDLLAGMNAEQLAGLTRKRGKAEQKVGLAAPRILAQAKAIATGAVIHLGTLAIPSGPAVMLDLEGMPPQNDELDKVYLWGMQAHGDGGPLGPYRPAIADFGPEGDREAWKQFLENAADIFRRHGAVPFVHWAEYERTKIRSYIERYGDLDGTAARVLDCCLDLLKAVRDSLALPVPSYGLKVIERLCGYTRTMEDFGGDWSIARYIRASESRDTAEQKRIIAEIARYNEEDLQAMAAVLRWARALAKTESR
jgi:predicted RecB family nuclease